MSVSAESIPKPVVGAEASAFGSDYVVLDPPGRFLRGLNETGARVWQLCDGERSAQEIAQEIASEFGADVRAVLGDVIAFLEALSARGLVEIRGISTASEGAR